MPATEYGKYLKKLRIDKDKTLAAMAKDMGIGMVSAFCKMRENKRLRLVGGGSRSHGKPGPQIVLRTHPKKNCGIIAYYGIKHGF